MEVFESFVSAAAELNGYAALLLAPALLLVAALVCFFTGGKKAYPPLAVLFTGAGYFLIAARDAALAAAYLGLLAAFAALLSLLFFLPRPQRGGKAEEELYEKFRLPLETGETEPPEEEAYVAEACGLRLDHAVSLLEKLLKSDLEASDRLEADALSHTLDGYRDRPLTEEEMRSLNDCLSTVLKLTAKYKL